MGRRPEPVDGEIEALLRLAADLRRLRAQAGNPPYRTMAVRANYSASTLSEAASGRRLATLPVVLAYVAACGTDTQGWEDRWRQAAAAVHAHREARPTTQPIHNQTDETPSAASPDSAVPEAAVPPPTADPDPANPDVVEPDVAVSDVVWNRTRPGWLTRRTVVISGAVVVLLLSSILIVTRTPLISRVPHTSALSPTTTPARVVTEDTDPHDTGCDQGQVNTVASANLYGPDRFFLGSIWLRYAPGCAAMWARFQPAAGLAELSGAQVTIRLTRPTDGRTLRYTTPYLGAFVYGNMLRTTHGCLTADATVTAPRPTRGPTAALPGPVTAHNQTPCTLPPASPR